LGALGQAVHQAVSKKLPKSPKLDIPFQRLLKKFFIGPQSYNFMVRPKATTFWSSLYFHSSTTRGFMTQFQKFRKLVAIEVA
jgi:hypothetical protein